MNPSTTCRLARLTLLAALCLGACDSPAPGPTPPADLAIAPPGDLAAPPSADLASPPASDGGVAVTCNIGSSADPLVVPTNRGLVRGKTAGDTYAFLGIPYAAPPVGALRFRPPAPVACWDNVRQAQDYGAECPQKNILNGKIEGSEDCLTLNVWTPRDRPAQNPARLPVLFFIHGGANILGASNQQIIFGNLYNGQDLAQRQGAVVVSVTYRIGALGFLAHPALTAESPNKSSGNYAILDQIAALRWVHDNITAFGGDPDHVLVFGESAGAWATCALLVSPLAKGLFSAALMESGSCEAGALSWREAQGQDVATTVGCAAAPDPATCLRSTAVEALVRTGGDIGIPAGAVDFAHIWDLGYGANADGWVIPDAPIRMIKAGRHNHVPFLIGNNAQEMELFLTPGQPGSCGAYEDMIRTAFGASAAAILKLYPCGLVPRYAAVDVMTDMFFHCPARRIARAMATHQSEPVYRYLFSHVGLGTLSVLRAFHAAELPFVFNSFAALAVIPGIGEEALSQAMQGYWASFARTGDPNSGGRPNWPRYDATQDNLVDLDVIITAKAGLQAQKCDFWDTLAPN